ncbi:MAG: response regulator transcription factor [Solirubrobacteraceae bacterium]
MTADRPVRVLVVEDSAVFQAIIREALEREGFSVALATDGHEGLQLARELEPPVVILDLNLPGLDGLEVCRRLRQFSDAYVVMLTGRDDEVDKLVGLSAGADDYVVKPFSGRELVARVRAMLRRPRSGGPSEPLRRIGDLETDTLARDVRAGGQAVELTRIEFDLLDAFSAQPRVVFSREQLLERVWGPTWFGDDHVVDVHLSKLRQKLGDDAQSPRYIRTVRGIGYRFEALD